MAAINHLWDHEIGRRRKGVTFVCGEGNENKEFEGHDCTLCDDLKPRDRGFIHIGASESRKAGSEYEAPNFRFCDPGPAFLDPFAPRVEC